MIVKLWAEEIREILAEALGEKFKGSMDAINPDDCFFEVIDVQGDEITDFEEIYFVWKG